MFKQLSRLSLEAEGRYADAEELKFVENYLTSVDVRLSAYQKIRDKEITILEQIASQMREIAPNLFSVSDCDLSSFCMRDIKLILRCSAIAMLLDDLDSLREGLLLWHKTIVNSGNRQDHAKFAHQAVFEVMRQTLSTEEFKFLMPVLSLNQTILAY
jgi:hypothetical protein